MCVCSFLPRVLPVGWESCQKARLQMEVSGGIWVWRQGRAEGNGNIGTTERENGLWFSAWVTMGGSPFPQVEEQRWEGRLAGSGEEPLATGHPLPCLTALFNWLHPGFLFACLLAFGFLAESRSLLDLTRDWTMPPVPIAVEAWSPNHWTTRKFPILSF